jgi:hypothetical protein
MKNWYEIIARNGHIGAGKSYEVKMYVFCRTIVAAQEKYKTIPRVKKNRPPYSIRSISCEETKNLEEKIDSCRMINGVEIIKSALKYAKHNYFCPAISEPCRSA